MGAGHCTATSATHPSTMRARSTNCRGSVRLRDKRSSTCLSLTPHSIWFSFPCHDQYSIYYQYLLQVSTNLWQNLQGWHQVSMPNGISGGAGVLMNGVWNILL